MSHENSIPSEIAAALQELHAAEAIESTTIVMPEPLEKALLDASRQPDGYETVSAKIEEYTRDLTRTQALLAALLARVKILAEQRARRERFNAAWLTKHRERLRDEVASDPSAALNSWLATLRSAVANWALSSARELAEEPFPFSPVATTHVATVRAGLKALDDQQPGDAIAFLRLLLAESLPSADKLETAAILACLGRAILATDEDSAKREARALFDQAAELAPQSGDVQAALGDWHRLEDARLASACYQRAIQMAPELPVGYSGLGLLAEDAQQWDESQEWFARAISTVEREQDIERALRRLLAPISGALLEMAARRLAERSPGVALHAVTRALALKITGPGKYPERRAYGLQGELLERLGQDADAAAAYYEAGRSSMLADAHAEARTWLEHSLRLRSDFAPTYWQLAESARRLAFDEQSKTDKEQFETAGLDAWRSGIALGPVAVDYSWAFMTRALLRESNEWIGLWQSIYFAECAILLNPSESYRWAYLGMFYDQLDLELCALGFTKRAHELNPDDLFVNEQHVTSLSNYGDFDSALALIEAFPNVEQEWFGRSVKAFLLYHIGQYSEAISLCQRSIEERPKSPWVIEIQAVCHRVLEQQSEACAQYDRIWALRDDVTITDSGAPKIFGVAGYQLGHIEEAARRLADRVQATNDGPICRAYLGLCRCAQGNLDEGEKQLLLGFEESSSARLLGEFLRFELKGMPANPVSAGWMQTERGRAVLQKAQTELEARRQTLQQRVSPQEQIVRTLNRRAQEFPPGTWPPGSCATLARLCAEAEDWPSAVRLYETLHDSAEYEGIASVFKGALENALVALGRSMPAA
jgi:tetratricopeptide (TPR) repeat protein